jgi:lysophospholipase L1-like esterase
VIGEMVARVGGREVDAHRRELNDFIPTSGLFDATVDFAELTADRPPAARGRSSSRAAPAAPAAPADYLHPNRAAYQAMGLAAAEVVLGTRAG